METHMNPSKDGIDFIIVSYYKPDFIKLLVKSIRKFVNHPYLITIIANETLESKEYLDLLKTYKSEEDINIIPGTGQVSFKERGGMAGVKWETDEFGNKFGPGSINHSKGLTLGMKNTNQKYICFLDNDTVFLNEWVEDILPMLEEAFLVSHRMDKNKGPRGIIREMFMIFKRKEFEKYNLYPNCEYVDSAGNITKCIIDNQEEVMILENSLWNPSLKKRHMLNLRGGEQAFIGDKPFFYHYGRGSSRGDDYYNEWIVEVTKILENK